jgi:hypothetical protein
MKYHTSSIQNEAAENVPWMVKVTTFEASSSLPTAAFFSSSRLVYPKQSKSYTPPANIISPNIRMNRMPT